MSEINRCDVRQVGQILQELCGLSQENLDHALEVQKQARQAGQNDPLCDVLLRLNMITPVDKAKCLGMQWGLPYVDMGDVEIDRAMLELLPLHLLREHKILPLKFCDGRLQLAIVDPINVRAVDEAHLITGFEIDPYIATEESLIERLNRLTGAGAETIIADTAKGLPTTDVEVTEDRNQEVSIEDAAGADEEPVIRLVNAIISRGIVNNASDIHIQPERERVRVRYRTDGVLHDGHTLPAVVSRPVVSRVKVLARMDIAEKRIPQDGRISLRSNGVNYDLRVSTLPGINGEKVVMRIAKSTGSLVTLNKLGFSNHDRKRFEDLISRPYGLILVTGPTGSGKSTTLYAALGQLNSPDDNIITIEDPVEQKLAGLTQIEVNPKAGLNFASALRSVLRQDPDIVMVGEVRDRETAMLASEASLTGHLVLSTLHTNDAAGAMTRLIDMDVEPFLIASSVIGVIAQRLVRVLCPKCREEYEASALALRRLGFNPQNADEKVRLWKAKGCPACGNTGYRGRMGVFELLTVTDEIKHLVLQRQAASIIRATALTQGMTRMADDAVAKILSGVTSIEEALRIIDIETVDDGETNAIQEPVSKPAETPSKTATPVL